MSAVQAATISMHERAELELFLRGQGLIGRETLQLTQMMGGQSNPTFIASSGSACYVLRTRPAGELLASAHAIDREFRVMKALARSDVPVPQAHLYCENSAIIGRSFYIMEFVEGRVIVDQSLPGFSNSERRAVYQSMNETLSQLHRVDPGQVGLGDFGRTGNYYQRQIARWSRQCRESLTEDVPVLDALMEWLPTNAPDKTATTLVHGDYRLDNLVLHPTQPRVIAVLDWELSTLGDPLADLSYQCMGWHIPPSLWRGIGGLDLQQLGIPTEEQYLQSYWATTGFRPATDWSFYLAFNLFRMASILQGIAKRASDGNAVGEDAIETGCKARPLAEMAWGFAKRYDAQARFSNS